MDEQRFNDLAKVIIRLIETISREVVAEELAKALQEIESIQAKEDRPKISVPVDVVSEEIKNKYPELLKMSEVANILRITRQDAYDLLPGMEGFPLLKLSERRMRVPRDAFFKWLGNTEKTKEEKS